MDPDGRVLECRYPERAIDNPVGLNMFDYVLPEYHARIKTAMAACAYGRHRVKIEYEFVMDGQHRFKRGWISHQGNGRFSLDVKRLAKPQIKKEAI